MTKAVDGELMMVDKALRVPPKQAFAERLRAHTRIASFKGDTILERDGRWVSMSSTLFAEACYQIFGDGVSRSRVADLEHLFRSSAKSLDSYSHYIAMGERVWNMKTVDWDSTMPREDCIYRLDYTPSDSLAGKIPFILELACGDEGVYDDIMKSVAPLILYKKPTGVIWYLGNGANGKSTLVHLLYLIFNDYLTELTVGQLEDERDTPQLNGKLGNVCKESSEGFIEDTRSYKSIGTHESFKVHKFHSQDMIDIQGNVHHIFSANNIPVFGDKSYGARRRTLVIPFNNRFEPDESFEDRTFTRPFIERFLGEMVKYAQLIKKQNYEYRFSATTGAVKDKYDTEANTTETYFSELYENDIRGFENYIKLRFDYENWCSSNGYKPSSVNVLRRAADEMGFRRTSVRVDSNSSPKNLYLIEGFSYADVKVLPGFRQGLYQLKDSENDVLIEPITESTADLMKGW